MNLTLLKHTYDILVWIHEDKKSILFCFAQYRNGVVYPLLIVLARPGVLDCLPRENVPDGVVPPTPQPRKVCIGILEGEGAVDKRDVVAVKELVRDVRGLIWGRGELGIGSAVDAMERDLTIMRVAKRTPVNVQSHLGHVCE
jgi:hypothetical protein